MLKEPLQPDDFDFSGTTMRSGGRFGLPASTAAADTLRPRVHDRIMAERGPAGYRQLQIKALASVSISGPNRIAKVLPVTGHDPVMAPNLQYPMGGGGLQWTIDRARKKNFLVALHVDPAGMADAGTFQVSLWAGPALPAALRRAGQNRPAPGVGLKPPAPARRAVQTARQLRLDCPAG